MNSYKKLQFDSELFGYNVARITSTDLSRDNLTSILQDMSASQTHLAYLFVDPRNDSANEAARSCDGFLADEKITYKRSLTNIEQSESANIYSSLHVPLNNAILSLALQSGLFSRFKIDPHFTNNEYEKLYKVWIENSLSGKIAKEVFVYKNDGIEVGLLTLGAKTDCTDIGLLAVDEKMRGKSIGRLLMQAAFVKSIELGYKKIQVVTQKANSAACAFYEKVGFTPEKIENVYHFWI